MLLKERLPPIIALCFLNTEHLKQIDFLNELIEEFDQQVDKHIQAQGEDFSELIPLLSTVGGVSKRSSEEILAEIGADMNQFPNEEHLSSWAGMCPGNGKREIMKPEGSEKVEKRPKAADGSDLLWGKLPGQPQEPKVLICQHNLRELHVAEGKRELLWLLGTRSL